MTRVKVCGLMNEQDISLCVAAGVDILGFVVEYPLPVPWNLTLAQAKELISRVPPHVNTCVVTGGTIQQVLYLARETQPDIVQLHYQETLQEIKELSHRLRLLGIKTTKALRVDRRGNCNFEITDPASAAQELSKTKLWAILVDSFTITRPGGTGVMVDLSVFKAIQEISSLPIILAGGLNPRNIFSVIRETRPYAVDVLTGIEREPGQKDPKKVIRFIQNAERAR